MEKILLIACTRDHSCLNNCEPELSEISNLLNNNNINVDCACSSSIYIGEKSTPILRVNDPVKLERILKNGIRILSLEDFQ